MKYKLENIDKKESFKVPEEGYFEDLPLKIQSRVQKDKNRSSIMLPSWGFAVAASIAIILVTFVLLDNEATSAETLLAEVPQSELIAYLDNIDLNLDELTSTFENTSDLLDFQSIDEVETIEMSDEEMEDLLLEYDITEDYL